MHLILTHHCPMHLILTHHCSMHYALNFGVVLVPESRFGPFWSCLIFSSTCHQKLSCFLQTEQKFRSCVDYLLTYLLIDEDRRKESVKGGNTCFERRSATFDMGLVTQRGGTAAGTRMTAQEQEVE